MLWGQLGWWGRRSLLLLWLHLCSKTSTDAVLATPVDNAKLVVELGVMALDNTDDDKDDKVEGGLVGELSGSDGFRVPLGVSDTVLSAPEVPLDTVEAISLDGVDDVVLCIDDDVLTKVDDVISSDTVEGVVPNDEEEGVLDSNSDAPVNVEVDALLEKTAGGRSAEDVDDIIAIGVSEVLKLEVAREVSDETLECSVLEVLLGVAFTLLGADDMLEEMILVVTGDMLLERVLDDADEDAASKAVDSNGSVAELVLEV
jgi:hypothetical protein